MVDGLALKFLVENPAVAIVVQKAVAHIIKMIVAMNVETEAIMPGIAVNTAKAVEDLAQEAHVAVAHVNAVLGQPVDLDHVHEVYAMEAHVIVALGQSVDHGLAHAHHVPMADLQSPSEPVVDVQKVLVILNHQNALFHVHEADLVPVHVQWMTKVTIKCK